MHHFAHTKTERADSIEVRYGTLRQTLVLQSPFLTEWGSGPGDEPRDEPAPESLFGHVCLFIDHAFDRMQFTDDELHLVEEHTELTNRGYLYGAFINNTHHTGQPGRWNELLRSTPLRAHNDGHWSVLADRARLTTRSVRKSAEPPPRGRGSGSEHCSVAGEGFEPSKLSRRIYSPFPLAARATCQCFAPRADPGTNSADDDNAPAPLISNRYRQTHGDRALRRGRPQRLGLPSTSHRAQVRRPHRAQEVAGMADSSFDIVSKIDRQEVDNALSQAAKELAQRYDFKGTGAEIKWSGDLIEISASADDRASAVLEVFKEKLIKRQQSLKILDASEPRASGRESKITITLKEGISSEDAKKLGKLIRDEGPKSVKAQIQGDELRVSSKSRDDLQAVQQLINSQDLDFAVQFTNRR